MLYDEKIVRHYLDNLRKIKIYVTGDDLKKLGIAPSKEYSRCFDELLKIKLTKPNMSQLEEIEFVKNYFEV